MFEVLFIDRSNSVTIELVLHLARNMRNPDVRVLLLSDKEKSGFRDGLEIVNVRDVPQALSLQDLQDKYDFSLHKALVAERSFFDYSSFRRSQCYSDMTIEEVMGAALPYINALDYLIRERVDLIVEGLADNFLTSMAGRIAGHYRKKFFMVFMYYWAGNGFYFVDRTDQTSSLIDARYEHHRQNSAQLDPVELEQFFARKALQLSFSGSNYSLRTRVAQVINRASSYEPLSLKHWLQRRIGWALSRAAIAGLVRFETAIGPEKFVLFPLHVTPEATLLGNVPELADQFWLIKNLSMNLPAGTLLYVKDHPHQQVGLGLDYSFYRRVQSLPNVRLYAGRGITAEQLYTHPNCLAVAVISGTVGLEAALRRVPVFVFGRPIYHRGDCFLKPRDFEHFFMELTRIRRGEFRFDETGLFAIMQALKDAIVQADVDLSAARSWLELGYLGNANTTKFIEQQYQEWLGSHTVRAAEAPESRRANA